MTGLLTSPFGQLGAWAFVALIIGMILTGRLRTLREMKDVQADRDHWRTAAEGWQSMAIKLGMSVEGLTASVEHLTASSAASTHALEEIQSTMQRGGPR